MNRHGQRFIPVADFISYCRDVNVATCERELEHYQKVGAMLSVARLVYPDEYVIQKTQNTLDGVWDWDGFDEWPGIERLTEGILLFPETYTALSDEQLFHCFDREMESNPLLTRPRNDDFKPWSEYRVKITSRQGESFNKCTVDHYYSHWQVHQLHFIQQYPDLYKNAAILDLLSEEVRGSILRPSAPNTEFLTNFKGMRHSFDALSFWVTVYQRERNRTFAKIDEINGMRRLNETQVGDYRRRLSDLARMVVARFSLTHRHLYEFLRQLIELHERL